MVWTIVSNFNSKLVRETVWNSQRLTWQPVLNSLYQRSLLTDNSCNILNMYVYSYTIYHVSVWTTYMEHIVDLFQLFCYHNNITNNKHINNIKIYIQFTKLKHTIQTNNNKNGRESGHWSRYLSHAKRALYHLS